jgi:hypothetical protein
VAALGSTYAVPPYTTRRTDGSDEAIPYRIVGAVAGTTLTYDPPVAGAPTTLTVGQWVDFEATGPFVVKSQGIDHPFYVAQMMTGEGVVSSSAGLGDEEYVNILPPAQYLQKYVFFTDPTYPTTNLVLTRSKTPQGSFADVTVDCIGKVTGWKKMDTADTYEMTNVDLIRLGTPNGSCQNGGHVATSDGPFGLIVWGLDSYSSYAYPAGGNVAPINTVVVPPLPK